MERSLATATRVLIGLVLLTPLIVMSDPFPRTFFPFIVGKALYARTMIELAFLTWVLLAVRYPAYRIPRSWLLGTVGIYMVAMALATAVSVSPQRSIWSTYERMMGLFDTAHWFLLALMAAAVFRSWAHWRTLLNVNLAVGLLMGLLGLAEHFDFAPVVDRIHYLATPQGGPSTRLEITLGNPTYVGAYYLVNVTIALGLLGHSLLRPDRQSTPRAVRSRRRRSARGMQHRPATEFETWWRVFWVAVVLLGLSMLFLSGTRGALAGLVVTGMAFSAAYLLWGQAQTVRRGSLVVLGSLLGLIVVVGLVRETEPFRALAEHSVLLDRIVQTGASDDSLKGRVDSATLGLRGFLARPVVGWGPENFTVAYDRYLTGDIVGAGTASFDQAHNKVIEELTTKGALGFLAYMAIWLYMLKTVVQRARLQSPHDQIFTLAIGAALAGYFVQNLFLFDTPGSIVQFIFLVGYMAYLDSTSGAETEQSIGAGATRTDIVESSQERSARGYWRSLLASRGPVLEETWAKRRRSSAVGRREEVSMGYLATSGVLVVAVLAFIFVMNYRPYDAAKTASEALQAGVPWQEKLALLDDSFTTFPPLANHPVLYQNRFKVLRDNLHTLDGRELAEYVVAAEWEGNAALDRNPKEWRIMLLFAQFYQQIGPLDPAFLERARELVDDAVELAPERIEVQLVRAVQYIVEEDYEGANRAIDAYLEKNTEAAGHFEPLRQRIAVAVGE